MSCEKIYWKVGRESDAKRIVNAFNSMIDKGNTVTSAELKMAVIPFYELEGADCSTLVTEMDYLVGWSLPEHLEAQQMGDTTWWIGGPDLFSKRVELFDKRYKPEVIR